MTRDRVEVRIRHAPRSIRHTAGLPSPLDLAAPARKIAAMAALTLEAARRKQRSTTLGFLAKLALLAWVLRCLIVEPFFIPSGSMLPNMAIGDYLFVSKWPYGYSKYSFIGHFPPFAGRLLEQLPERGDVVVFKPPGNEGVSFVKRVIGLPGDRVEVHDGMLLLNGVAVPKVAIGDYAMHISDNSPCRTVGGLAPRIVAAPGGAPIARRCRVAAAMLSSTNMIRRWPTISGRSPSRPAPCS